MRSNLPAGYLYADVLLNFFKIVELVTHKRTKRKPELEVILKDNDNLTSKNLNFTGIEEWEAKEFYRLRC